MAEERIAIFWVVEEFWETKEPNSLKRHRDDKKILERRHGPFSDIDKAKTAQNNIALMNRAFMEQFRKNKLAKLLKLNFSLIIARVERDFVLAELFNEDRSMLHFDGKDDKKKFLPFNPDLETLKMSSWKWWFLGLLHDDKEEGKNDSK